MRSRVGQEWRSRFYINFQVILNTLNGRDRGLCQFEKWGTGALRQHRQHSGANQRADGAENRSPIGFRAVSMRSPVDRRPVTPCGLEASNDEEDEENATSPGGFIGVTEAVGSLLSELPVDSLQSQDHA